MVSDFKKNKNKSPFSQFLFKLGGVLILFISILLIIADIRVYHKKQQLNSQVEILKDKIQNLDNENNKLKQDILKSDDNNYIEKVAREELDLQKPGEKVISFIVAKNQQQQNKEQQKNILQFYISNFWNWLKNKL